MARDRTQKRGCPSFWTALRIYRLAIKCPADSLFLSGLLWQPLPQQSSLLSFRCHRPAACERNPSRSQAPSSLPSAATQLLTLRPCIGNQRLLYRANFLQELRHTALNHFRDHLFRRLTRALARSKRRSRSTASGSRLLSSKQPGSLLQYASQCHPMLLISQRRRLVHGNQHTDLAKVWGDRVVHVSRNHTIVD